MNDSEILRKFKSTREEELNNIRPIWNREVSAALKYWTPNKKKLGEKFEVISTKMECFIDVLYNAESFMALWGRPNDIKTAKILHSWELGIEVTLPIVFPNNSATKLIVADGNHRLICSIYLGQNPIELIIPSKYKEWFIENLKIEV